MKIVCLAGMVLLGTIPSFSQNRALAFRDKPEAKEVGLYYGDTLLIYEIGHSGGLTVHRLGSDPEKGESFQAVVKAGSWFASIPAENSEYALVGCTVSPGFDFAEFELADRAALVKQYPQHTTLIESLTR